MSHRIKVSVLITTYNHRAFIKEALESALAQVRDFSMEVIIGDDFSNDGTREIIEEYAEKYPNLIRPLLWETKIGAHLNFARMFERAQGEYIAVLDGDDYWTDPLKLWKQLHYMERNPKIGVSFHPVQVLQNGKFRSYPHPPKRWQKELDFTRLLAVNFIPFSSVMYRQNNTVHLPELFFKSVFGDWLLHLIHANQRTIGYLDDIMGVYRLHPNSAWSRRPLTEKVIECLRFLRSFKKHYPTFVKTCRTSKLKDQLIYFIYTAKGTFAFR